MLIQIEAKSIIAPKPPYFRFLLINCGVFCTYKYRSNFSGMKKATIAAGLLILMFIGSCIQVKPHEHYYHKNHKHYYHHLY